MNVPSLTIINEENFSFFHDRVKNKEVAYKNTAVVDKTNLLPITKAEYEKAGNLRKQGNKVSFDTTGKAKAVVLPPTTEKPKWFEKTEVVAGNPRVVSKSKEELENMLKEERNRKLNLERIYIDDERYFYSDKETLINLASYLSYTGNPNLVTTWHYSLNHEFSVTIPEIQEAYNKATVHRSEVRSDYAEMMNRLAAGDIRDFINWDKTKSVGVLNV